MSRPARSILVVASALVVLVAAGCDKTETRPTPADAYVDADTPTTAHGTEAELFVDASPQRETFLQFDLTDVTKTVVEAKLRLHVADTSNAGSPDGGQVAAVTAAPWSESTLTFADRPTTWGPTVAEIGAVTANTWVEVSVTPAVTAGTVVTLGIRSANTDGATYDSRESGANARS
ncbi:MAG: DNRLRE domain-containing protein [Acidimicrobiales bacterium]